MIELSIDRDHSHRPCAGSDRRAVPSWIARAARRGGVPGWRGAVTAHSPLLVQAGGCDWRFRKLPAAGSVVFLVVRYLLIAAAVYATIYVLRSSPAVLVTGLLVSFFAVVLELLFGLSVSK